MVRKSAFCSWLCFFFFISFLFSLYPQDNSIPNVEKAYVSFIEGEVYKYDQVYEQWDEIAEGVELAEQDSLKVGKDSLCEITFKDGTIVTIAEESQIVLAELTEGNKKENIRMYLYYGNVISQVDSLDRGDSYFEIESTNTIVGVRGTEFDVSYEQENLIGVNVYDGEVVIKTVDEQGKVKDKGIISRNQSANIVPGKVIRRLPKLDKNRETLREFIRNRIGYVRLDRSINTVQQRIDVLKSKMAAAVSDEKRQYFKRELEKLYQKKQDLFAQKQVKKRYLSDVEKTIKEIRQLRTRRIGKLKNRFEKKFVPRYNMLQRRKKQPYLLKNSPDKKRNKIWEKKSHWQDKIKIPPHNGSRKYVPSKIRRMRKKMPSF
jgi:hypothetical protein